MSHLMFMYRLMLFVLVSVFFFSSPAFAEAYYAAKNVAELQQALSLYYNAAREPWIPLPSRPQLIKSGTQGSVVLLLRERLRLTHDLLPQDDTGSSVVDDPLFDAIKSFQERHGLKADGVIGNNTRVELNVTPDERIKQIELNIQRWNELTTQLGDRFVMVNVPDFNVYLVDHNELIFKLRAIVGKTKHQTPEISSRITRIVFYPYWNIPSKIVRKEIAPKMLNEPGYLDKMHINVFEIENDSRTRIDPESVNWENVAANHISYQLRQDPGPENALGIVKFEFPNKHHVYLHDTPAKNLFEMDNRDFSHGCIRMQNPFALVDYLMKDDPRWNPEELEEILDEEKTKYVSLTHPIPIFITYITAWVDNNGRVNFRNDLYRQDSGEMRSEMDDDDDSNDGG